MKQLHSLCDAGKITREEHAALLEMILSAIDEAANDALYGRD